jgi:putative ABC transport system permease protein
MASVWQLVLGDGLKLAGIALRIGLSGVFALSRVISGILSGIVELAPITLISATAIVTLTAVLATCLPALRATRVDPLVAMRSE